MPANKGKVILAAAGPGDPDLITVKAALALQVADVVLVDRLVSREIIRRYCRENVEVVEVGKQGGKLNSTPQKDINVLLVEYAGAGRIVVRLKGGDVSVFANILDELQVLQQHRIPFEIIPGVTSALGAAAYAGIPLTARGYATALRILTYYHSDIILPGQWKELARTSDTLVFYMSAQSLNELSAKLVQYGMDDAMPLAIVENATTSAQQVKLITVCEAIEFPADEVRTPALVIIGKVAALHQDFQWFRPQQAGSKAFAELPVQTIPPTVKNTVS